MAKENLRERLFRVYGTDKSDEIRIMKEKGFKHVSELDAWNKKNPVVSKEPAKSGEIVETRRVEERPRNYPVERSHSEPVQVVVNAPAHQAVELTTWDHVKEAIVAIVWWAQAAITGAAAFAFFEKVVH